MIVIPAKAGIQDCCVPGSRCLHWTPTFAGVTDAPRLGTCGVTVNGDLEGF